MKNWRGKKCSVPGCPNNARCRGMCTKHYNRKREREKTIDVYRNKEDLKYDENY